jgi:hypothetical protein
MEDFTLEDHGSVYLLRGNSEAGDDWLDGLLENPEAQFFGNALAVGANVVTDVVSSLLNEGYVVRLA